MGEIDNRFKVNSISKINENCIIKGEKYRFSILTDKLIRIEYCEDGVFEDRATQSIWNRTFDTPKFRVIETDSKLEIITDSIHLYYTKGKLSSSNLYIDVKNNLSAYSNRWYYGQSINTLKGTCRTLDAANGEVPLEEGVLSKEGLSIIDDSKSLIVTEDGWIEPRKSDVIDMYFFGYGREYLKCLADFYKLTGATPLLPKYALGNWWSRYWRYDEKELKSLMSRFKEEDIPFSVCVMDMDWHKVNIPSKYGSGWTGYSWNKDLFPNPHEFMCWLHKENLKVTLNLHPADGVKAHEDMYEPMAMKLGIDYKNEDPIQFDIGDYDFMDAYFKYLHNPHEDDGVDFWWIDWQQGNISKFEGLDPLWMLNHYHTCDISRNGKRGLIFSRYSGVGSHRYPVGFSGDTYITWDSYRFQPYFTSTASNIGYSWWSHDIGGHFMGCKDDELNARWVQFGVFSPIMRLHSSSSIFNGKEPWRYSIDACNTIKEHLRLRHKLIPYLYTMNWRTHNDLIPMIQPMYYQHPYSEEAYNVQNQYMFGSELMVCPITEKINPRTCMAGVDVWLPEGEWIDFFNGTVYNGDKKIRLFRGLESQPVLAKAGAIVPLSKNEPNNNSIENPKTLEILVFPGSDNTFTLYEDNGEDLDYKNGKYVTTKLEFNWGENTSFKINRSIGDRSLIPERRDVIVKFRGINVINSIKVLESNIEKTFEKEYNSENNTLSIIIKSYNISNDLNIILGDGEAILATKDINKKLFNMLNKAQIEFSIKDEIYYKIIKSRNIMDIIMELQCMKLEKDIHDAVLEILLG